VKAAKGLLCALVYPVRRRSWRFTVFASSGPSAFLFPRDLAKRHAEVQALRELVRIKEEEVEKRTVAKGKGWSLRRQPVLS
jgi:hypothetical protein